MSKNIPEGAWKSIMELHALKKDNDLVAAKCLHESADRLEEMEFLDEIDLMKRIGYHERLVNLMACVTTSEPCLLVLEYCANGDLLKFMRDRRVYMVQRDNDPTLMEDRSMMVTLKEQLMWGVQIAYGMEYLSQRGFVHRDLAARNVLVDEHRACKIGDFGLCREVGKESEHYHSRGGRLPIKWLPPESLEKYAFSTASDVWSYGVLLFEIITLGGFPYPDWPAHELLYRLKAGDRMDRPDNCSDDMWSLLNECWSERPNDRPPFTIIRKRLARSLETNTSDAYYLRLNGARNYYRMTSECQAEDEATIVL